MKPILSSPKAVFVVVLGLSCLAAGSEELFQVQGVNLLAYRSSPYSFELQGRSGLLTDADGSFGAYKSYSGTAITASIFASPSWLLTIGPANGASLAVGYYPNAGNVPSPNTPWISFSAFSRHCSQSGAFKILQLEYGPQDVITALAVDFVTYDFGMPSNWSEGYFRYNSLIPIPEPTVLKLFAAALLVAPLGHGHCGRRQREGNRDRTVRPQRQSAGLLS
jgi:hypothetical protein